MSTLQELQQNSKPQSFANKIKWILASLENNQIFHSIAYLFARFTTFSERNVSLREEKSNVSPHWIGVKWFHFNSGYRERKLSRSWTQSDYRISRIPPAHEKREKKVLTISASNKVHRDNWNDKILCPYGWYSSADVFHVELCFFIVCVFFFSFSLPLSLFSTFVDIFNGNMNL